MSTVQAEQTAVIADETVEADDAARASRTRKLMFWVARYLPAEIAGTAAMVVAGLAVTTWTENPAAVALAALLGEFVGFYAVLALTVYVEQRTHADGTPVPRGRALVRTGLLLVAEFGPSELIDSFLVRPAALLAGVWMFGPLWGMIAGKIVADILFYAIAAGAFTVTVKTGMRQRRAAQVPT